MGALENKWLIIAKPMNRNDTRDTSKKITSFTDEKIVSQSSERKLIMAIPKAIDICIL
jgi:hypothetical protein